VKLMASDTQKKSQKPSKESYSTDLLGLGTACECVEAYADDGDENGQIAGHPENLTHNWSGWPEAFCLDCGIEDQSEICVAEHEDGLKCVEGHLLCEEPHAPARCSVHVNGPCPVKMAKMTPLKTVKFGVCPFCDAELVGSCRCIHTDSQCARGHSWHYDEQFVHAGDSDHAAEKCCGGPPIAVIE
jgi:hypothetical protein